MDICKQLGIAPKRYDKRLKFFQQHLGILETEQQVLLSWPCQCWRTPFQTAAVSAVL